MTFFREGKKLSYEEVVAMHESLIKQNILPHLEIEELSTLFIRIVKNTEEKLKLSLVKSGYRVEDKIQVFEYATKLKIIPNVSIWQEALEICERINNEEITKADEKMMTKFMSQDLLRAMQQLIKTPELASI